MRILENFCMLMAPFVGAASDVSNRNLVSMGVDHPGGAAAALLRVWGCLGTLDFILQNKFMNVVTEFCKVLPVQGQLTARLSCQIKLGFQSTLKSAKFLSLVYTFSCRITYKCLHEVT